MITVNVTSPKDKQTDNVFSSREDVETDEVVRPSHDVQTDQLCKPWVGGQVKQDLTSRNTRGPKAGMLDYDEVKSFVLGIIMGLVVGVLLYLLGKK